MKIKKIKYNQNGLPPDLCLKYTCLAVQVMKTRVPVISVQKLCTLSNSNLHSARTHKTAPHNRYHPHPAEPAQHTTCSNIRLVLLKMGIMMPETCWEIVKNKHLTVASCWFSLSLHNLWMFRQGNMNEALAPSADCTWTGQQIYRWDPCMLFLKDLTSFYFIAINFAARVNTCCNSAFSLELSSANKGKVVKNSETYGENYTWCRESTGGEEKNICV